jgi:hypothetical protein
MVRATSSRIVLCGAVVSAIAYFAGNLELGAAEAKKSDPKEADAASSFGSAADGVNTTTGTVLSTGPQSVDLSSDNRRTSFYANKSAKDTLALIHELVPSDKVTITWTQKDARKWIQKIEGRGSVEGFVTAKTADGLEVTPDSGFSQRAWFPWAGLSTEDAAKLNASATKRLNRAKVGDRVQLTWQISDAKRAVDVKTVAKAPTNKSSSKSSSNAAHHSPHYYVPSHLHAPTAKGMMWRARRL